MSGDALPALLGALAGLTSVLAAREFLGGSVALAGWIRMTVEPLQRVRAEGYLPDSRERNAVALLAVAVAVVAGMLLGRPLLALLLGLAAPFAAAAFISRDRRA